MCYAGDREEEGWVAGWELERKWNVTLKKQRKRENRGIIIFSLL